MIIDGKGRIVAHTDRGFLGNSITRDKFPQLIEHLKIGKGVIREFRFQGQSVKEFSVPIKVRNEILGLATVAYSIPNIDLIIKDKLWRLKKYIYLISGIMILAGIIGAVMVSNVLTRPLKKLKAKMLNVQSGNLNVEAENPNIVKCWERLNCHKEECPSYGHLRCWAEAGTFCHGKVQGEFAQKIGDCRKCVVYRESCGDEINELIEVFNQMVKDLRYNLDELEQANKEKAKLERLSELGEMATTVAHETKNPLNSIRLATSYLKKNFRGEILSEFLTIIEEEVRRLNDITSNFLGFSRPAPLKLKPCDINAIIKPTVELIRQEATERNIELILLTDENLSPVNCDYSRIKQAILNLLINAMDVSGEGDSITVTTESENSNIKISVQDTGPGITNENTEKIFKPFYTTKTRGSGLGLAIVDRVAKEHNGEIKVDSSPGKGTKFTIVMPVIEYAKT
ncbi:MAG TPA: sensor histidine kinase [Nitrospirae bacterium]|nr:sensor histidine kinase [Nitrospirota bacterium]